MKGKIGLFWLKDDFRFTRNLALSEATKNPDDFPPLDISSSVLREIQRSMRSVISSGRGTARKYELNGYGLAG